MSPRLYSQQAERAIRRCERRGGVHCAAVFGFGAFGVARFAALAIGFAQVIGGFGRIFAAAFGVAQHEDELLVAVGGEVGVERSQPQRGGGVEVAFARSFAAVRALGKLAVVVDAFLQLGMTGKKEGFVDVCGLDLGQQVFEGADRFARVIARGKQSLVADFVCLAFVLLRVAEHRRQRDEVADQRHPEHGDDQGEGTGVLRQFGLLQRVAVGEVRAFMRHHGGELGFVLEARDQSGVHIDAAVGQGEGVDLLRVQQVHVEAADELGIEPVHDALQIGGEGGVGVDLAGAQQCPVEFAGFLPHAVFLGRAFAGVGGAGPWQDVGMNRRRQGADQREDHPMLHRGPGQVW